MNKNKQYVAPKLDISDNSYTEFYALRKHASTMTVETINWFRNHVNIWFGEIHQSPAILSIGSGKGDIDIEVIKSILPHLDSKKLKYDALEPNLIHYKCFMDKINTMSFNEQVSVSIHDSYFDKFNTNQQYDVVLLIHVLYYFDDPYQEIQRALKHTKPGGKVIIIHQSSTGIPEIQHKHMLDLKNNEDEIFTTDDIKKLLDDGKEQYIAFPVCI